MTNFWENAFNKNGAMWGDQNADSADFACKIFTETHAQNILVPGYGYGRNARVFIQNGMKVTGIEISETAINIAKSFTPEATLHLGSVLEMPFDNQVYDGIFSYAILHLLSQEEREKFIKDCYAQLMAGRYMIFTTISKAAPQYGKGTKLADCYFEISEGLKMYFYDEISIAKDFEGYGLESITSIIEPNKDNPEKPSFVFFNVVCRKPM